MARSNSCQECSPVKPETTKYRPVISISLKSDDSCITIGKDTVRALGNPEYITMLVNWEVPSVAIMECKPGDNMSFKVPNYVLENVRLRIHAKSFIKQLSEACNLPFDRATRFQGVYNQEKKAVIFDLSGCKEAEAGHSKDV